jgi:hypothetical protein
MLRYLQGAFFDWAMLFVLILEALGVVLTNCAGKQMTLAASSPGVFVALGVPGMNYG